jgi:hypothetical protein
MDSRNADALNSPTSSDLILVSRGVLHYGPSSGLFRKLDRISPTLALQTRMRLRVDKTVLASSDEVGNVMVRALCYKREGLGFDTR